VSSSSELFRRYQELQQYVSWEPADAARVLLVSELLEPHFHPLIDDFYQEIERHPDARRVITGGDQQIERLKGTLRGWLKELFSGQYDEAYVSRRSRVGWRHVEIGLDQVFANQALSRLRLGLLRTLQEIWTGDLVTLLAIRQSLNKLIDLDLAIIQDAYQTEYLARQQRNERLATIGQVSGGVAHELRNPLNVIKTSVYYLLNAKNASPEKIEQHLKRIEQQVVLADSVITTLSNFAKMPLPELRPVSLAKCIEQVLETNPLPSTIEVKKNWSDLTPQVMADMAQLQIIFGNLIRNARDAMPNGGQLSITACHHDKQVEIAVSDTGVGIAPEHVSRVMEPLFSTKARGLGLGLAIARSIVEKNKGTLRVSSELGRGTTFKLQLVAASD
jgi:signal transduction histidine kinase